MQKTKCSSVLTIFTDGASRGNPGPSGIGVLFFDEKGKKKGEIAKYIGIATNNVAEYMAVIYALQEAVLKKAKRVVLNVDSELVVRQLNGEYRVKDADMQKFFGITLNLFRLFDEVKVKHLPRTENKDADSLANKAINLEALI